MSPERQTSSGRIVAALYKGVADLGDSLRSWRLWTLLGWLEIRQRYARSKLGPLWLTISMGVMVGTLGLVYGSLFGQPLAEYLPVIAIGIVMWALYASIVNEGCVAYIHCSSYIRQVKAPRMIYIFQVVWRNLVIFAHNFVIIVVVIAAFGVKRWDTLVLFVPGMLLFLLNASWAAALFGLVSARFRDLPQIVAALLQVAFYVTPILFQGNMLGARHQWLVKYNPLAYLIDIVRLPLVGQVPSALAWGVVSCMAIGGWVLALMFTGRYHKQISYWI